MGHIHGRDPPMKTSKSHGEQMHLYEIKYTDSHIHTGRSHHWNNEHPKKEEHKEHLKPYKKLYICLDRDATTKAYDIAKDLRSSGFDNVVVKPLEDDLKYFNTKQIEEIFYDRKTNA